MSTMQAMMFIEPQHLELREVEIPTPGAGEVVIKVEAATTCGTDLKGYRRGHRLFRPPMIFGHEYAGYVHAVGDGVTKFKEGDMVVGANSGPCNSCYYCRRGLQEICEVIEGRMNWGSYAEYFLIPDYIVSQNLHHKPEHVPFAEAAFIEPLACAVLCINRAEIQLGDTVAIIGAGAQSLMQIQLAKSAGASRVIVIGRSHGRLEQARQVGADVTLSSLDVEPIQAIKDLTDGRGADVAIEASGNEEMWQAALLMTRKGGTCMQFSGLKGGTQVAFDAAHLHYGEVTMKGVFHHIPRTVEQALQMIASGIVDVKPMLSGEITLSQVEDGLQRMARSEVIKLAVIPSKS